MDALHITAHTSDGRVFSAPVCMAKAPPPADASQCSDDEMLVTPEAQDHLQPSEIWYHLGGWCDDGDTYETQLYAFERDLSDFWADLVGPDEQLRQSILAPLDHIHPEWKAVHVTPDGRVQIEHADGSVKTIQPHAVVTAQA